MDPDISKWPLFYQIVAFVAAALTGVLMWLRGARPTAGRPLHDPSEDARELARLRDERQQDHDRQVTLDIRAMRADFEIVIKALKESVDERFDTLSNEIRCVDEGISELSKRFQEAEKAIAVFEDRFKNLRPRR